MSPFALILSPPLFSSPYSILSPILFLMLSPVLLLMLFPKLSLSPILLLMLFPKLSLIPSLMLSPKLSLIPSLTLFPIPWTPSPRTPQRCGLSAAAALVSSSCCLSSDQTLTRPSHSTTRSAGRLTPATMISTIAAPSVSSARSLLSPANGSTSSASS